MLHQLLTNILSYRDLIISLPTDFAIDEDKHVVSEQIMKAILEKVGEDKVTRSMTDFYKVWQKNVSEEADSSEFLL